MMGLRKMSRRVVVIVNEELNKLIEEEVNKNSFDYEGKVSVFVRGCIIRRLRELNKIK